MQDALAKALEVWRYRGVPDNPRGWLYRVARNRAMDILRRDATLREKLDLLPPANAFDEPPRTFEELMEPFPPEIREVAAWLRSLLLTEFPQLDETIHGGRKVANALYSIGGPDRVALGIQPGLRFVKLFIHDPDHLPETEFKLEGRGRHMRHVKLDAIPEAERDELVALARVPVSRRS